MTAPTMGGPGFVPYLVRESARAGRCTAQGEHRGPHSSFLLAKLLTHEPASHRVSPAASFVVSAEMDALGLLGSMTLLASIPPAEGWPSGLRRTLGKRVCVKAYRGFESHSLRQNAALTSWNRTLYLVAHPAGLQDGLQRAEGSECDGRAGAPRIIAQGSSRLARVMSALPPTSVRAAIRREASAQSDQGSALHPRALHTDGRQGYQKIGRAILIGEHPTLGEGAKSSRVGLLARFKIWGRWCGWGIVASVVALRPLRGEHRFSWAPLPQLHVGG